MPERATVELIGPIEQVTKFERMINWKSTAEGKAQAREVIEGDYPKALKDKTYIYEVVTALEKSDIFLQAWNVIRNEPSNPLCPYLSVAHEELPKDDPKKVTDEGFVIRSMWKWVLSKEGGETIEAWNQPADTAVQLWKSGHKINTAYSNESSSGLPSSELATGSAVLGRDRPTKSFLGYYSLLNFLDPEGRIKFDYESIEATVQNRIKNYRIYDPRIFELVETLGPQHWYFGFYELPRILSSRIPLSMFFEVSDKDLARIKLLHERWLDHMTHRKPTFRLDNPIISRAEHMRLLGQSEFVNNWGEAVDRSGNRLPSGQSEPFDPWGQLANDPYRNSGPMGPGVQPR